MNISHNMKPGRFEKSPRSFTGYFNFLYRIYFKTPPLCFAMQNIGEVARSDGGVKVLVR